jgi:hypothetical protein
MRKYDELVFNGAAAANGVLDNDDAVDAGGGLVTIPIADHGLKAGSLIHIAGSVAYDGNYAIQSVAAGSITVMAPYVAEEFSGEETFISGWKMPYKGTIAGIVAKLSAGVESAELMSVVVDSVKGSDFDFTIDSHDFDTLTNWAEMYENPFPFDQGDIISISFANSTSKTFGVRLFLDKE